jgi:hypothetical protein
MSHYVSSHHQRTIFIHYDIIMPSGQIVPGSLYLYAPVKWAPPIFVAWFMVSTMYHVYQCQKFKAWKVTGLQPTAGLFFTLGFAIRSYGAFYYSNIGVYVASTILIYCAP